MVDVVVDVGAVVVADINTNALLLVCLLLQLPSISRMLRTCVCCLFPKITL